MRPTSTSTSVILRWFGFRGGITICTICTTTRWGCSHGTPATSATTTTRRKPSLITVTTGKRIYELYTKATVTTVPVVCTRPSTSSTPSTRRAVTGT